METKRCTTCDEVKPVTEFDKNNRRTSGLQSYCRSCNRAAIRRRRGVVDAHLEPPEGQTCEICGAGGRMYLDHDHDTGTFRGWLCNRCNMALGVLGSVALLRRALAYLDT